MKKVERIKKYCLICRKKFKVIPSVAKIRKYCSKKCFFFSKIGKHPSLKTKAKMSISAVKWGLGKITLHFSGKLNVSWKGDKAGYRAKHCWINKHYGKANHCENNPLHKSTRFHWANISGKYIRNRNDYKQLCPSCHIKMDKRRKLLKPK